jgi:hypothetical protein
MPEFVQSISARVSVQKEPVEVLPAMSGGATERTDAGRGLPDLARKRLFLMLNGADLAVSPEARLQNSTA